MTQPTAPSGQKIGYARVSTHSQNEDSQVDELKREGCRPIFVDRASGKLAKRPQLDACMAYMQAGDTLVITRLSRAMRSLHHLLELSAVLKERGVGLKVLKQDIDTTTSTGRLVFHIMAAIDEFQRELIVEGTNEGLAAARARGRHGGRPRALSQDQAKLAREMYDKRDRTVKQIADALGTTRTTIYRTLEQKATT
jgi:DNA invertase Pin-like site-specific DNA recombinase